MCGFDLYSSPEIFSLKKKSRDLYTSAIVNELLLRIIRGGFGSTWGHNFYMGFYEPPKCKLVDFYMTSVSDIVTLT